MKIRLLFLFIFFISLICLLVSSPQAFKTLTASAQEDPVGTWNVSSFTLPYRFSNHPLLQTYGKLTIFGGSVPLGFTRSIVLSSIVNFDGSLNNWENLSPNMPKSLIWHAAIYKDGYVYILGGAEEPTPGAVNSVDTVYRGTLDGNGNVTEWVPMTPLPQRLTSGAAVLIGNRIYYSGGGTWTNGWGGVTLTNIVYFNTIDPSGNLGSWQVAGYLPNPTVQHVSFYSGSKLIIIGGAYSTSWSPNSNVYSVPINPDGTLGAWVPLTPLTIPVRYPMLGKFGDLIIVAGGVTTSGPATDEVYYSSLDADGNTGDWSLSANKLPQRNCCTGSAVWNNHMYITGGHDNISTYYDTVVMTLITPASPPPPSDAPIVFLPGLAGCFNFKEMFLGVSNPDGWKITPGSNVYNNLLKTFENKSYFHVFCYDWRKPVWENAQKLNDYIKNEINQPENKVDLIGHSLGGLVARTCVQKTENNCFVDKLITVGSPHFGAVDAYPAIEGGEIWRTGPIKLGYELLVHFNQKLGETKRDTLERIAPVIKNLLPNFPYLTKNGTNLDPDNLSFKNELLPLLQDYSSLNNLTKTISGRGFESTETINLGERSLLDQFLGLWSDGKPINQTNTEEGDTSVLVKSASFDNPQIENFLFVLNHGQIISEKEPLEKIIDLLEKDIPAIVDQSEDSQNYLVFIVHSPVKINLKNPPQNSLLEDEIVIVPDPPKNDYQIELIGLENGQYQFSIGQIFNQTVLWNDYEGMINQDEVKELTFSIDPQNPNENPLIDPTGKETILFLENLLEMLKEQINSLNLKHSYLKKILQNLTNINSNYPRVSLVKLGLLRNTLAGYERKNLINPQKGAEIRSTCSKIAIFLENLTFNKEIKLNQKLANAALKQALKLQKDAEKKLSSGSAFVFQEAQEKLKKAQEKYDFAEYYQSQIYSLESISLFSESIILSQ